MLNNKGKSNRRGQSTVEYIVLVSAVIAVMIVFLTNKNTGLQAKLNTTLEDTADQIGNMSDRLEKSHSLTNEASGKSAWSVDPTKNVTTK
jgi:hypothetical protein